jgi:hypothetical protein
VTTVDLDTLTAALDPDGRGGRRHIDDLADQVRVLLPHLEPSDVPGLLRTTIQAGEDEGRWSASRSATVQRGRTRLPKFVTLPYPTPTKDRLAPVAVPLRSELASWGGNLRLSATQRQLLVAVNDWLRRTNGGNTPVVAAAERAYELIHDEKAFDSTPPRGGSTLWRQGRLTFELLRCERLATPLTWEPVTTTVSTGPMVCVENHATFRTLLRVLRAQTAPQWTAVAWVQGRNIAPLGSLPLLPFTVSRMDYLGDLDPAGLEIAVAVCAAAQRAGVRAGPADHLWSLLIERPSRAGKKVDDRTARQLVTWLPDAVRDVARTFLVGGRAVPQEALRFDVLSDALL